jgi:hypothetical protein
MRSDGADVVVCGCSLAAYPPIVSTAFSQGFKPTWISSRSGFTPQAVSSDGTTGGTLTPAAEPMAGTLTSPATTPAGELPDAAGWDQLKADTEKYAADYTDYRPNYVWGYTTAMVAVAILRKAIENDDLSRAGLLDAKTSLGEIDLQGLMPNVTYGSEPSAPSLVTDVSVVDLESEGFLKTIAPDFVSDVAKEFDITTIDH